MRLRYLLLLFLPASAMAEAVQIPGPPGPLEAEQIAPEGAAHAVVIVPGSGPTDRDGNSPQSGLATDTYKLLAEGLAVHGIASLRIDKRGFFGSEAAIADPNDVTIAAYADDLRGWVNRASQIAPCVWIAGHSEGGLVALVAAKDPPASLCGLILLATPGRPVGQLMIAQFEANPANAPIMPEIRSIVTDLEAGTGRDPTDISPVLQSLFSPSLQRYMIDLFSYDPTAIAADWNGPALIMQGDADVQVSLDDANLLKGAMQQARRVNLPGGTHMLKEAVPGDPLADYYDPTLPLHDMVLPSIVDFISENGTTD
ncbi:alpha/beta fold hydrolase [Cognatiyoonia sp. IB215446]|uniref:alpha/beta hydrolase n=1 Tax=Cognatiyoonia sp. IB215446 TaxID=3097355 RepID=UPI002A0B890F|nr:alpha/beta fold hydrolase [Cognatiyoonia sp. IB215446]MDX8350687.1 alpha/beta fold hydrolase [Cognatiyoonia sp. IB215446]